MSCKPPSAAVFRALVLCLLGFSSRSGVLVGQAGGSEYHISSIAVANAFWPLVAAQPADSQVVIMSHYQPLLTVDTTAPPADRAERLSLGEAMFLSYKPAEAAFYFRSLLGESDLISRHAADRMMQIRFRAYDDSTGMRSLFDSWYTDYPPTLLDTRGRFQQLGNLMARAVRTGDGEVAIDLLLDELRHHAGDAPYRAYELVPRYRELIRMSPRAAAVNGEIASHARQLSSTLGRWRSTPDTTQVDPQLSAEIPRWFWVVQDVRPGESFRQARIRQLSRLVEAMEDWLLNG